MTPITINIPATIEGNDTELKLPQKTAQVATVRPPMRPMMRPRAPAPGQFRPRMPPPTFRPTPPMPI